MHTSSKICKVSPLLTVIVTVHAYVFYSLYVVNGSYFSPYRSA